MTALYVLIGFLSGSLMFSYWLGLAVHVDIREVGDGNPGGFNLCQAAGYKLGLLGILLEVLKGYLPLILLLSWNDLSDLAFVFVAIAPILGHAFSPFVGFQGGKSIAVSFGVWSAVTRFDAAVAFAVILALIQAIVKLGRKGKPTTSDTDGCMVVAGMLLLGGYLTIRGYQAHILLLWLCNLTILAYTNRWKLFRSMTGFYNGIKKKFI